MITTGAGYTNASNEFIFIYSSRTVTIKDAGGNVVQNINGNFLLPPNYTVTTGVTGDVLYGLIGGLEDLRGFLLSSPSGLRSREGEHWSTVRNTFGPSPLSETELFSHT